ncbi:MAG: lipoyl synthase [Desulfobacterales bacterium]
MTMEHTGKTHPRKPPWLKRRIPSGSTYRKIRGILKEGQLHTVCQEAHCPNLGECFSSGTATFIILGNRCTRDCRFCAVSHGPTGPPDPTEPRKVAEAVVSMGLDYVVITSVTRDDLPDGGAGHFAETICEIRRIAPAVRIEVLIPDLQGAEESLEVVVKAQPDVLNHNLETVPRIYPTVRPGADYGRSLGLFSQIRNLDPSMTTKSGLMLGLGESAEEIRAVLGDLLKVGCGILTLGQYLQPSKAHLPVERFVPPEEFDALRRIALEMGFDDVASGPFVRSSYKAHELYRK